MGEFQEKEMRRALEISRNAAEEESREMARALAQSNAAADEEEAFQAALAASLLEAQEARAREEEEERNFAAAMLLLEEPGGSAEDDMHPDLLRVAEDRAHEIVAASEADWILLDGDVDDANEHASVLTGERSAAMLFNMATPPGSPRSGGDDVGIMKDDATATQFSIATPPGTPRGAGDWEFV